MKKVIVTIAAMMLVAGSAMAGSIVDTKHDLSSTSLTTGTKSTGTDEICVFCHTPHSASAAGFAPLWNRTTVNATAYYTGVDIQANITLAGVNASDAPLCLSCHDGASLTDPLVNPPNAASGNELNGLAEITNANAVLGTDLRDDHPIGFDYDLVAAPTDPEIDTRANATSEITSINFYNGSDMWCSSCHDVHDNTNGAFLVTSNAGSQLCLACHIK